MPRSDEEIEEVIGRQFAMEAMLTHLIWEWARGEQHPPSALSRYLRPIEEGMQRMVETTPGAATRAAQEMVRGVARELERTLHQAALRRASEEGPVQ